jgi:hypothetical protein
VEPCSTSLLASPFISAFFTTECHTLSETDFYQDERALPGDLHSRKRISVSPLLNVMSHTTHQLYLLSRHQTVKKISHDIFLRINAYSYLPQKEGQVEIFEVLTAVKLLVVYLRIVTPCRFVGSFVGTFRIHPQC